MGCKITNSGINLLQEELTKWYTITAWYQSPQYYVIRMDNDYLHSYKLKKFTLISFTKYKGKETCIRFTNLKHAENICKILQRRLKNYTIYVDKL